MERGGGCFSPKFHKHYEQVLVHSDDFRTQDVTKEEEFSHTSSTVVPRHPLHTHVCVTNPSHHTWSIYSPSGSGRVLPLFSFSSVCGGLKISYNTGPIL